MPCCNRTCIPAAVQLEGQVAECLLLEQALALCSVQKSSPVVQAVQATQQGHLERLAAVEHPITRCCAGGKQGHPAVGWELSTDDAIHIRRKSCWGRGALGA
jgi:hypothetical protein